MSELVSIDYNTQLSTISIQEYLTELDNFYIEYLNKLNVDNKYTFGIEIEYKDIYEYVVKHFTKDHMKKWKSSFELNIDVGGEVISPILKDNLKTWKDIKKICNFIKEKNASFNVGGHIHIGSQILGYNLEAWKKFVYLYTAYEDIIYHFSNGNVVNGRTSQITCAAPMAIELAKNYDIIKDSYMLEFFEYLDKFDRFNGLNFNNVKTNALDKTKYKNTIEFRMPNGTFDEEIWQNNIYFFIKLLEASKNNIDMDYLSYKIKEKSELENYHNYYKLDMRSAVILADTIFDNNFDKARFLKQYYKDGREIPNSDELITSSKQLIKKN